MPTGSKLNFASNHFDGIMELDSVVSQEYFLILAKVQIDFDPMLHQSGWQTGMSFSDLAKRDFASICYRIEGLGRFSFKSSLRAQ